jgi:sterol desaturase/sphingolipid hydroxylase (fatty acid hydroxylase superfamily)
MRLLQALGPLKTIVLAVAIFIPFERLAAERPAQAILRRGWATDLLTGAVNGLLLSGLVLTVLAGFDALAASAIPALRVWMASRPFWAQVMLAIVLGDLGIYLMHRLEHSLPWLWRLHAVHHSADEMDWLIAFRFHPFDLFLMRIGSLTPLVVFNLSPGAIAVFVAVFGWQSWLVHANVRLTYGPLRWALVSPDFHHWHHGAEREAFDRNYGSIFAIWDVVFGTAHLPPDRYPLRYGIEEPMPPGYVERFFQPFRRYGRADHADATEKTSSGRPTASIHG